MNTIFHLLTTIIFFFLVNVASSEPLDSSMDTAVITQEETQETKPLQNLRRGLDATEEDIGTSCTNEHEEFVRCRSSSCFDKTCYQVRNPGAVRPCTRDCKSGCACKDGYVRNSDGMCYKEDVCYSGYYDE